ncbi:MAG: AmmeMemoRadiSam system protein B [Bacteroidales bacterium]
MQTNIVRNPAVAGRFYPSNRNELLEMLREIYSREKQKISYANAGKKIYGAVVPHAGYMFSAYEAVHFFGLLPEYQKKIETFIIINPNHTGHGEKISLDSHKIWLTPFGEVEQDMEFISSLGFPFSDNAHSNEHAGEVMLPLLQYFVNYNYKVVMITLSQQNVENAKEIARQIKKTSEKLNREIMIIASSDFTHFKDAETGKRLDNLVLDQIEKQDSEKLNRVVRENNISVCGFGPIMCLMEYAALNGNYQTSILARGHSGMIMPSDKVVDYITILFSGD